MTLSRRQFLRTGAAAGTALIALPTGRAPAFVRSRPVLTHGVQSGEVSASSGLVWARADRPSRMLVEVARTPSFRDARLVRGPIVTPASDLTGKVPLWGLRAGREVYYRVSFEDVRNPAVRSEPAEGSFRTAPRGRRDVSFVWTGDLAGQGWGINPEFGGFRIFGAMAGHRSRLLPLQRRHVYADGPLTESGHAARRPHWRNVVTDRRSARSPRRSTSSAASSPTTCSTSNAAPLRRPTCRRSTSGTTTR